MNGFLARYKKVNFWVKMGQNDDVIKNVMTSSIFFFEKSHLFKMGNIFTKFQFHTYYISDVT